MPCDGKNTNCERRRELLSQLKCLVTSMDRRKPCEWDEPSCPPPTCCPVCPPARNDNCTDGPPCCSPVKACNSFELRGGIMYRCECIMRNGLQDRCMMYDCMGRPECMTKLYPVCGPGRAALLKLTDLGDAEVALKKFYCADQARENALAAYCRLTCGSSCAGPPCPPPCPPLSCPASCPPPRPSPPCCFSSGDQASAPNNSCCPPRISCCPTPCGPPPICFPHPICCPSPNPMACCPMLCPTC